MKLFAVFFGIVSISSTVALTAQAAVKVSCEQALFSENKTVITTGSAFTVRQKWWGGNEFDQKVTFIGQVGDSFWAMRGDGKFVTQLDGPVGASIRQNKKNNKIPRFLEIEQQATQDNCVETAMRYIMKVKKKKEALVLPMAPSTFNPFGNPFLNSAVSFLQQASIINTLNYNGFHPNQLSSLEQMVKALKSEKIIFIGAKVGREAFYIEDESGDPIETFDTMVPRSSGRAGHAMVIVSMFKGEDGNNFVMLADPASGTVRPVLFDEEFFSGIILALSI